MRFKKYSAAALSMMALALIVGLHGIVPALGAESKKVTIGIAQWGSSPDYEKNIEGFKAGLQESGYTEGKNVTTLVKNADTNFYQQVQNVEFFVKNKVDLIYALTTPGALAAKSVTKNIPIVFSIVTYPVEAGIIESLDSSGNNLTGTRNYIPPTRQYFYFEQIYPGTKNLAFVHHKGESNSDIQYRQFKELLAKRKVVVHDIAAVSLEDMRSQLESSIEKFDSVYSACDTLIQTGGGEIVSSLSQKYKKPNFVCTEDGVQKGALMGTLADFYQIGKISGQKAALILRGMAPTNIITESSREDSIVVNIKTAQKLGLFVPKTLLDKAKRVIDQ